jgi:DNA repair exonuclease SbcCD ATPase subunit
MKIILKGFKCHGHSEYEFLDDKLNLLSGRSGAGKTSVLQSIMWCLYGGGRGFYDNTGVHTQCSVTVIFNSIHRNGKTFDLIVYRQGRPGLFKVTYLNNEYLDKAGQGLIDRFFGSKELWRTCSYIEQGLRCKLLNGSNSERMQVLNQLSFFEDDPTQNITVIDQQIKELNDKFINIQAEYKAANRIFTEEVTHRPINTNINISIEALTELKTKLFNSNEEKEMLNQQLMQQQKNLGTQQSLLTSLKQNETLLKSLPKTNETEISTLNATIEIYRQNLIKTNQLYESFDLSRKNLITHRQTSEQQVKLKREYEQLSNQINDIRTQLAVIPIVTEQNLIEAKTATTTLVDKIETIRSEIAKLIEQEKRLIGMEQRRDEQIRLQTVKTTLIEQLQIEQNQLSSQTWPTEQESISIRGQIEQLEIKLNQCELTLQDMIRNETIDIQRKKVETNLNTLIARLEMTYDSNLIKTIYTDNYMFGDLIENRKITEQYQIGVQICNKYGIAYDNTSVDAKIREYQNFIDQTNQMMEQKNVLKQIVELEKQIAQLPQKETTLNDINEANRQLNNLENSVNLLYCPHCNLTVRYHSKQLHKESGKRVTSGQVQKAKADLAQLQQLYDLSQQKNRLIEQLQTLRLPNRDQVEAFQIVDLSPYISATQELSSFQIVNKPKYSNDFLEAAIEGVRLHKELQSFGKPKHFELPRSTVESNIQSLKSQIEELRTRKNTIDNLIARHQELINSVKEKQQSISNIVIDETIETRYLNQKTKFDVNVKAITSQIPEYTHTKLNVNIDEFFVNTLTTLRQNEQTQTQQFQKRQQLEKLLNELTTKQLSIHFEPEIDSKLARAQTEYDTRVAKIRNYYTEISFVTNEEMIQQYFDLKIKETQNTIKTIEQNIQTRINITSEIETIKTSLSQIVIDDQLSTRYDQCKNQVTELEQIMNDTEYGLKMTQRQKQIEQQHNQVVEANTDLAALRRLRELAVNIECKQLEDTVNVINVTMERILERIFDSPIVAKLQLYKQLKSNKRIKPTVNLSISYKGVEYTSINDLSGGEKDRASFALILALSAVSQSPILMLDEVMASLDQALRSDCLDALRECLDVNKTIICVNHEDTEGNYDKIVFADQGKIVK